MTRERCFKIDDIKCAFKGMLTMYFNDPGWQMPEDGHNARVPVRVMWEGTTSLNVLTGEANPNS